ncbi:MAG: hypothetical protein ACX936_21330, partial [Marinobacter sp.]
MQLEYIDLETILPSNTPVLRIRKVANIAAYLSQGNQITDQTTMRDIAMAVKGGSAVAPGQATTTGTSSTSDIQKGAPKTYTNFLEEYSGDPIDWEDWEIAAKATIGQTVYSPLTENPPANNDAVMKARDMELYHALVYAVKNGTAMHIVENVKTKSGHTAWKKLQEWYGSDDTIRQIIDHYQAKLDSLYLDDNITASEYINVFIRCCDKLEGKGEGMTPDTKLRKFLEKIVSDDYAIIKEQLANVESGMTFVKAVSRIRRKETDLQVQAGKEQDLKARRVAGAKSKGKGNKKQDGNVKIHVPSIPFFLTNKIRPRSLQKALLKWRSVYNEEGRHIQKDEVVLTDKGGKEDNASVASQDSHTSLKKGRDGKKRKKGGSNRRVTKTRKTGVENSP